MTAFCARHFVSSLITTCKLSFAVTLSNPHEYRWRGNTLPGMAVEEQAARSKYIKLFVLGSFGANSINLWVDFKWAIPSSVFSMEIWYSNLPMTGFKIWIPGVGSNWYTYQQSHNHCPNLWVDGTGNYDWIICRRWGTNWVLWFKI